MTVMSLPSRFTSCQTQTIDIVTTLARCVAFKSAVLTERTSFTNYKRSVLIQFPNLTFKMPAMISKFYKKKSFYWQRQPNYYLHINDANDSHF